jgi:hypothetical protein
MARPPQFAYPENDSLAVAKVKALLKDLSPEGRAFIAAWLVKFYDDRGMMYSPQSSRRRQRIALDGVEYWLVRTPKQ